MPKECDDCWRGGNCHVQYRSPSEGHWLHAGKNSRGRQSKVKANLLRERDIP